MSDTTTPKKPIWTRCKGPAGKGNGCGQRVFNDRIDIERHQQHCPADLERLVDKLKRSLDALDARVETLESTEVVIPEQVDLDDVSDVWPAADGVDGVEGLDEDARSTYDDDDLDFPDTRADAAAAFTRPDFA